MPHWLDKIEEIINADTIDLNELCYISGGDPQTFYIGTNLSLADTNGQNLSKLNLTKSYMKRDEENKKHQTSKDIIDNIFLEAQTTINKLISKKEYKQATFAWRHFVDRLRHSEENTYDTSLLISSITSTLINALAKHNIKDAEIIYGTFEEYEELKFSPLLIDDILSAACSIFIESSTLDSNKCLFWINELFRLKEKTHQSGKKTQHTNMIFRACRTALKRCVKHNAYRNGELIYSYFPSRYLYIKTLKSRDYYLEAKVSLIELQLNQSNIGYAAELHDEIKSLKKETKSNNKINQAIIASLVLHTAFFTKNKMHDKALENYDHLWLCTYPSNPNNYVDVLYIIALLITHATVYIPEQLERLTSDFIYILSVIKHEKNEIRKALPAIESVSQLLHNNTDQQTKQLFDLIFDILIHSDSMRTKNKSIIKIAEISELFYNSNKQLHRSSS